MKPILYSEWKRTQGIKTSDRFAQDPVPQNPLPFLVNPETTGTAPLLSNLAVIATRQRPLAGKQSQNPQAVPSPPRLSTDAPSFLPTSVFYQALSPSYTSWTWDALASRKRGEYKEGEEEKEKRKSKKYHRFIYPAPSDSLRQHQGIRSQPQHISPRPDSSFPVPHEELKETLQRDSFQTILEGKSLSFSPCSPPALKDSKSVLLFIEECTE